MFSDLWWFAFFGMVNLFVWSSVLMFSGLFYLDYRYNRAEGEKFRHYFADALKGIN